MIFKREYELIRVLFDCLDNRFDLVARELPVGARWVDIALASYREERHEDNSLNILGPMFYAAFKKLSMTDLRYLSIFIDNKQISIHYLMNEFMLDSVTIKTRFLSKFLELELVEQVSKYMYRSTCWTSLIPGSVTAIEAKLSDRTEAINQAVFCRSFADYAFVALDGSLWRDEYLEDFKMADIGLLLVFQDNVHVKLESKRSSCKKYNQEMRYQRVRLVRDIIIDRNTKWHILNSPGRGSLCCQEHMSLP